MEAYAYVCAVQILWRRSYVALIIFVFAVYAHWRRIYVALTYVLHRHSIEANIRGTTSIRMCCADTLEANIHRNTKVHIY